MGTSTSRDYSRAIRRFEIGSLAVFAALSAFTVSRVAPFVADNGWLMVTTIAIGFVASDFTSGFVHWIFDTWGTPRTPFLGKPFIRPFREHHTDEKAITRHDFVETNANNCFIGTLPLIGVSFLPVAPDRVWSIFAVGFVFWLVQFTMLTNQFHKWAHSDAPPRVAVWLQRIHLILPPAHHARHHTQPFHRHYAITVGWTNWVTDTLRFYRALEWMIRATTGAIPRRDDLGEVAARVAAPALSGELGLRDPAVKH